MDGELPPGWAKRRVDEIAAVIGGTTPSRKHPEYFIGSIPWVTPTDVTRLRGRYLDASSECVSDEAVRAAGLQLLPAGTLLLTSRATIGATAIASRPVTTNQGFQNLVPFEGTDPLWLYYQMGQRKADLDGLAGGSTFREFSRQSLRALRLLVPPPDEQRGIAGVLDTIDEAIEKTEAVIAATEELRKALLQELLTRGVPGWHTEWKQVPGIGTIPACWEVVRLGEVATGFQYGTSAKCDGLEQGVPVLRIPNVARGLLDLEDLKYAQLPERELTSLRLQEGDLLFVRTNGNPEICGRVALVKDLEGDWAYASYLVRLRTTERLLPAFLWLYLNEENGRRALSRHIRTSAGNFNLSVAGAASIEVPLPSIPEQEQIVASVAGIRGRENCERRQLEGLRELKARSADALLSGRVRVKVV